MKNTITNIFETHSHVEEPVEFEGEILEKELIIAESKIKDIAESLLLEYEKYLFKKLKIKNESFVKKFIKANL